MLIKPDVFFNDLMQNVDIPLEKSYVLQSVYALLEQKSDSHLGRTVKKLQIIKKSIGFILFLMFLCQGSGDSWPAGHHGRFTLCVCFCVPTL